jgi:hypothetical protein
MDDPMLDLMAGNDELSRRLGAYGLARLSPDLAATSRMRARVLAVAHRQAALTRAAGLAVLSGPALDAAVAPIDGSERPPARSRGRARVARRFLAASMAAMLALTVLGGSVFAARAGGPLYGMRLWVEEVTLPSGASERAVAELARLRERLNEATEATTAGDAVAATAALVAYGAIVEEASAEAILAGDDVAAAAIEAGVARNVTILEALAKRLPDTAAQAVSRAVERAIERSAGALETIGRSKPDGSGGGGNPNPAGGGASSHKPAGPGKSAEPNKPADPTKAAPNPTPNPAPTPERTPKPGKTPPADGKPSPKPAPTRPPQPGHSPHGAGGSD